MSFLIIFAVALPVLSGVCLGFSKINDRKEIYKFLTASLTLTLAAVLAANFTSMGESCTLFKMPMGLTLSFTADKLAVFFTAMFAVMSLLTAVYSWEYMKKSEHHKRFAAFYLITLGCVLALTYADNPFTFYTFFEGMSLASFILVLHNQTEESLHAAKKYIYYSIFGAFCALIGIMAFYGSDIVTVKHFQMGGVLSAAAAQKSISAVWIVAFIAILGFSCKADMFPLHGWISDAYPQAPSPISALLSGVLAKTGLIAIIRIVFYVVGADILRGSWVQLAMLALAIITIFMGSMMAYNDNILKRRLAYSSVSQISYAIFGIMMLSPIGIIGALLQMVFHALAKTALFMCSGNIIYATGKTKVSQMDNLGKSMPVTFTLFTLAGMSLIGVPLTGGFVSKYYLAMSVGKGFFPTVSFAGLIVIMISALLTGGYIMSVTARALFADKTSVQHEKCEVSKTMLVPAAVLVVLIIACGIYPTWLVELFSGIIVM